MKEQINSAIQWLKDQPIKGCITGSCLLDYYEGQDVDIFVYDEKSFIKLLFAMHHSPMFNILDPLEKWKFNQYIDVNDSTFYKFGLITIKFMYNTCVPVNIVLKKKCQDIFSVISSFDIDIICRGYDIQTQQYLDLSQNLPDKTATWNRWNTAFSSDEIWQISRILRQLERCFKYHKRGYNTDLIVLKYIELIEKLEEFESCFNSENFNEKLKVTKANIAIVKQICQLWLETHEITDEQLELLKIKMKEI
jgi:glycerol-3-phosphate cytidylyltransferase-like family protein